jgi:hypothetical protein
MDGTTETSPDADMTNYAQVSQFHDSEDEFILIDSLFEDICGNDDNNPVTNNTARKAALDTDAADQSRRC